MSNSASALGDRVNPAAGESMRAPLQYYKNVTANTINLLDATGHYTPERVAAIQAHLPIPARLCTALSLRLDPLDGAAA